MIGVLTTGLTGVLEHQKWLDNIANNVSNVNTDGYKKSRTTFSDLMSNSAGKASGPSGNIGGINPKQIGTGVATATMETIHTQGALKSTDSSTDLALQGDGFFVVNGGGVDLYTRNGNFGFDAEGNLVYKPNGFKIQGLDEDGIMGDIKVDPNDIMMPVATSQINFEGEINKNQAQGIEDVALDNGNTLKFKKVLGTDETYNYYPVDQDGDIVTAKASSTAAKDLTLDNVAGTITVNGQLFYLNNYMTLNDLMADVETLANVDMNYEKGILSVAATSGLDDLKIANTGDSLMGVKIDTDISSTRAGLIQDYFDGFGEINQGNTIGTVDGRVKGGEINGFSKGLIRGIAGIQSGPTATANGEIIGNLQGLFNGEGMANGEIKLFNGYLKGDVGAVGGDTNIGRTPAANAWIDGTVSGSSIGSLAGAMTGYIDSTKAPSAATSTFYGDFKIDGHTVGFAQADSADGIYGEVIGDAGITAADVANGTLTSAPVTINGPGKIQGSVGGVYSATTTMVGARNITDLISGNVGTAAIENLATLGNVTVKGAVFGTLSGKVTGEFYQWEPATSSWGYKGQVYEMNVDGVTGAVIGEFTGDITGIAQGDIFMDDTSTVAGVVAGIAGAGIDHDANGVADAYINIDKQGKLKGDFEGQVDIYGKIFADEMTALTAAPAGNPDWVRADFDGRGWLNGALYGDLEGTVNGEAHGEINGLIKHAAVDAQHFIGKGATMSAPGTTPNLSHLNIKFDGQAIGHIGTAISQTGGVGDAQVNIDSTISDVIEGLTGGSGAYINGTVQGVLNIGDNINQNFLGFASGTTTITRSIDQASIEGEIKGEVSSRKASLEGDYDGYFEGRGEVEGHFEGTMSGPGSFEGEVTGIISRGHMVGWAEGFVENAGPVSGMIDLDNVVFNGTFKGKVEMLATETIFGNLDGKMDGTYKGQIDAEKKDIPGLFTGANVLTGLYEATGGRTMLSDGQSATVAGERVTANENYKINKPITVYDQLGQMTKLVVTLEHIGDNEWNITTSDGGQGKLTFDSKTGRIDNVDYNSQYELDLGDIIQVTGINEVVLSQDGNAKGHLQKASISIGSDGTITGTYDNGLTKTLGQVVVATFNNDTGLEKAGTTMFAATENSGRARTEAAGSIRSGKIASNKLEASNVNLTQELSDMILAQQAFTAGVRLITTGDRLITEMMRMRP